MKYTEGLLEVIRDLAKINSDSVACYYSSMDKVNDLNEELREIFKNNADKCHQNARELTGLISFDDNVSENIVATGKIYGVWRLAKNMFNTMGRNAFLNQCECGEEAALEAYKTALTSDALYDYASRKLIMDQKYALQISRERIKKCRDLQQLSYQLSIAGY